MTQGELDMAQASAVKVFGSEFFIEAYRLLGEVLGQASLLRQGSPGSQQLASRIERLYRTASIITFGGGTNEIQRDIISAAGRSEERRVGKQRRGRRAASDER